MKSRDDLTQGGLGIVLWCLPVAALIVGLSLSSARPWLWIPAFLVMGTACVVNAIRCGRIHCYLTGPIFLIAAVYVTLAEFHLAPMQPGTFLDVVLVLTVLAYLAELPLGKYGRKAS